MSSVVGRFSSEPPSGKLAAFAYKGRPTTMIIGRDGHVRRQLIGARDFDVFEEEVRRALDHS